MLSEWLVDVPEDLASEWTAVVCPQGRRCLVVASYVSSSTVVRPSPSPLFQRYTCVYTKTGHKLKEFESALPGGSRRSTKKGAPRPPFVLPTTQPLDRTLLDCVFCEATGTFWVLDVLNWNNMSCFDSEVLPRKGKTVTHRVCV